MSDLKVCRICLRTEAKMYNCNLYQLKFYYEEVMALKMNEEDGLPLHFCYECAHMLHKFHKFKEKCYIGQKILKELLWRGPITYELVYKVDRNDTMLCSPVSEMTVNNRVKTFTTKDSIQQDEQTEQNKVLPKIENVELDYFSEGSFSDREEIKEPIDEEKIESESEKIKIDDEKKDIAKSPEAVYVAAENGVTNAKCEKLKDKSKSKGGRKIKANSWKIKCLENKNNWKITVLSEEDALKEFRLKAEDKKYLAAAFKCKDCFKGFSKKDMLDRHIQLRHIEQLGSFECRFCGYRYKLDCYLSRHIKQHYMKYDCQRCDLSCPLENTALLHEEYHSGVTRKCAYCDEEFRHSSTYYSHLRTHRSEHVCTLCGASFVSKLGLRQHKQIKHVIIEIESPDDDEEVNTYCQRCDIRFETRKAYEEHLFHSALHTDEDSRKMEEEKIEDEGSSDSHDKVSPSKKVLGKKEKAKITKELRKRSSDDDHFNFKRLINKRFKKERRQHTKPTTCHQCGAHFATQAACMKHHMEAHPRTSFHPPNERYICEICGASLAPGSIANHQNMHTREKLHTCDTCGRQFHAVIGLKRHMVTHTGEKPYACPLCDKRFTQSNSMKLHYKTFHLKQPYPKRNRRKKKDEPKEAVEAEESNSSDSSDDSDVERDRTGAEPVANVVPDRTEDSMHYLTLT